MTCYIVLIAFQYVPNDTQLKIHWWCSYNLATTILAMVLLNLIDKAATVQYSMFFIDIQYCII